MKPGTLALAAMAAGTCASVSLGQLGYGVNGNGVLFSFDLNNPAAAVTTIGNLGFVPAGIDFRPGTSTLYALNVGPVTTQLYTVNIATGQATAVGNGFGSASVAAGYNLTGNQTFGFDFNPTTLQGDGSMRIRLVSSGGSNLRLNSSTGTVAAIDGMLNGGASGAEAAAYINSAAATAGGTTALYVINSSTDRMYLQSPPNAGTLSEVGPFGVTIDALSSIHFDILTDPLSVDGGIGGDAGYAVARRAETANGQWLMYNVNLGSGQWTNGVVVGSLGGSSADFAGGFAVLIPSPGAAAGLGVGVLAVLRRRR